MYEVDRWQISVPVEKLLSTLKANRESHIGDYSDAVVEYREQVKEGLSSRLAELDSLQDPKTFLAHNLKCPVTYQHVYDRVIKMLEMTDKESVQINGKQFAEWVEDQWDWSHDFNENTVAYSLAAKAKLR